MTECVSSLCISLYMCHLCTCAISMHVPSCTCAISMHVPSLYMYNLIFDLGSQIADLGSRISDLGSRTGPLEGDLQDCAGSRISDLGSRISNRPPGGRSAERKNAVKSVSESKIKIQNPSLGIQDRFAGCHHSLEKPPLPMRRSSTSSSIEIVFVKDSWTKEECSLPLSLW